MKSRFVAWLLAAAALAGVSPALAGPFSDIFVFGDSLSDTGNAAAIIGARDQVIANNSYVPTFPYEPSERYTNAGVWVETFAPALGLSAEPAVSGGGIYAFGGASTGSSLLPPGLQTQTDILLGTHDAVPADALYVVAGGGGNARDALHAIDEGADPSDTISETARGYAQDIGEIVEALQAAGAHDIIVWDTPNLGLAPATPDEAVSLATTLTDVMNDALAERLRGEDGVRIFDIFGLVTNVVAHPGLYGLSNVTDACGAIAGCDPAQYLFWDGVHPTSAGHLIIAESMLALALAVPEPSTFLLLLFGMALLAGVARRK